MNFWLNISQMYQTQLTSYQMEHIDGGFCTYIKNMRFLWIIQPIMAHKLWKKYESLADPLSLNLNLCYFIRIFYTKNNYRNNF